MPFRNDFCWGYASCPYHSGAIHNTLEQFRFAQKSGVKRFRNIFRKVWTTWNGMRKQKFSSKSFISSLQLKSFFSAILFIHDIVAICFPCRWHHVTCFWTALIPEHSVGCVDRSSRNKNISKQLSAKGEHSLEHIINGQVNVKVTKGAKINLEKGLLNSK